MAETVKSILKRWEQVNRNKSQWHSHWEDLARVMLPRRMGFQSQTVEGESRMEDVFDGTAMQAARGLANAVGGMLRPEGRRWFALRAEDDEIDETDEAKAWLADSEERLINALENPKARFRQATGESDLDLVVFGSAIMFAGEGRSLNHLLFQSVHLKDGAVFFNEEGEPEGMFRVRNLTLHQAEERFTREKLSEATRKKLENDKEDDRVRILHAITPRKDGRPDAVMAKNLPFSEMWIEIDAKHEIKKGGFHEFPFIVPRWDTSSGEDYGRSPGMIALPDSNTLQAMQETMLVAGQRAADPPLFAPNDGAFDAINTYPGGLSYYDVETAVQVRGNPFFPLDTGSNMPLTREMQMDMREQVFSAFFRNILNLPVDGPEMTATEVIQRKEEFIREIGPVFGRLESDYTAPMIERAFNVMLRAGAFDEIPPVLRGRSVRFSYESPVKRIRQQTEAAAAAMWAREQADRAQIWPEAADVVNVDALARFEHEAGALPHQIVNSRETVARIRQARAQQLQQAQEAAEIQSSVETMDVAASAAQKLVEQGASNG